MYVHECLVCMYVYTPHGLLGPVEVRRGYWIPWNQGWESSESPMQRLKGLNWSHLFSKSKVLDCWAAPPAPTRAWSVYVIRSKSGKILVVGSEHTCHSPYTGSKKTAFGNQFSLMFRFQKLNSGFTKQQQQQKTPRLSHIPDPGQNSIV